MAESTPSRPSGSSVLVESGASKATDSSFLPGMLCWEVGLRLWEKSTVAIPTSPGGVGLELWQCNAED